MHQQPADRVHAVATGFVLAAAHLCREAHRLRTPAPPGKLRRVMKNEDRAIAGGEPAPSRVEMAPKNIFFAHPVVGEEAIGCLCVGPVLASQRDALSEPGFHLLHQLAKAAVQPTVAKPAAGSSSNHRSSMTRTSRPRFGARQGITDDSSNARNCGTRMVRHQDVGN